MSLIEAFIIGLLQGLTEFLPISSSAHMKIAKLFLHTKSEGQVIFDLVCHLGTLMALLIFLKDEIVRIFRTDRRKLLLLFLATLPLIPCYFLLKPLRDFASQPHYLGVCLMLTALFLFCGQKWRWRKEFQEKHQISDALLIGTMQSAALIPGLSRSASTISCAQVLGWEVKEAVRFSFLLSIPTVIGGNCLELLKVILSHETLPIISWPACVVGLVTAFAFGLLVIRFALGYLEKGNLKPFAWYCLCVGALLTMYFNLFCGD
jgi:undecaprenyl-diphosphatase